MTRSEAYLILNALPLVGPVRVRRLREALGSVEAIFSESASRLGQVEGIGREAASSILNWQEHFALDDELSQLEKNQWKFIDFEDRAYPGLLKEIYDPPLVLYLWGSPEALSKTGIAVVGSRKTTYYGTETAKKLSYQMAYAGLSVNSGLARGIDTAAHQGALAAKGITHAVMGSSLDQIYPADNRALAEKIAHSGGALLSEFKLGTAPDRQTFPMRNRIVSGLSRASLVVEAGERSGALITSKMALEQGRTVFAVPGRIDSPESKGCHGLIKQGAKLVESVDDILEEFEFLFPQSATPEKRPMPDDLTEKEVKILSKMGSEEIQIDELIQKCDLPSAAVSSTLLRLEMRKLVKQLPGKTFVKTD
ncbi:MAG: DNA-processing protein DprA [Verrucomicrobiota bacterium]